MSSGGFRGTYAFFIIGLMILGVIAGAFYFYHPSATPSNPCFTPGNAEFSSVYYPYVNGNPYQAVAANFTKEQENFVLANVTFLTVAFSDPSQPHLIGNSCGTDTTTPATITLQVTFAKDHTTEDLTIQYKGSLTTATSAFSTHNTPQAGVQWQPGTTYLALLVSF